MFCHCTVGSVAQSVKRIDTNWTVLGSNPDVAEIFRTRPDRPWGPTSNLYNGYRGNPSDTAAGAWRWPPTPSIPEATERVQLYLPPPRTFLACSQVNFNFYLCHCTGRRFYAFPFSVSATWMLPHAPFRQSFFRIYLFLRLRAFLWAKFA